VRCPKDFEARNRPLAKLAIERHPRKPHPARRLGHIAFTLAEHGAWIPRLIDLDEVLDDDVVAAIRRALLDHLVIFFFRDQALPPERFLTSARRFA